MMWSLLLLPFWIIAWFGSFSQVSQVVFPILLLLITPLLSEICTIRQRTGVDQLLLITNNARKRAVLTEVCTCLLLTVLIALPKLPFSAGISLMICAVQLALLSEAIGLYTNSRYPIQFLILIFIYLYLNGAPMLPINNVNVTLINLIYLGIGIVSIFLIFVFMLKELRH